MHEHSLVGCNARPLAGYLKSLGVFRIIAEQKDHNAKAWWEHGSFRILTLFSRDELNDFLCQDYAPTPIVAPWNGASGFFPTTRCKGMEPIVDSRLARFALYREVIGIVKSWPIMQTSFPTVGNLERFLLQATQGMREGHKKDEIIDLMTKLHDSVLSNEDLTKRFGAEDYRHVEIAAVERYSKGKVGKNDPSVGEWAKAIKKARTRCLAIQRSSDKEPLILHCRSNLPDALLPWIDAVCAIGPNGASFNPLLGTGGCDGKLDLSNNFMTYVADLFIKYDTDRTRDLLMSALYHATVSGLAHGKIGQYDPGFAGGYNQGMEVETKEFKINPWDFVFMLEGTLVMASAVSRLNQADASERMTAPFTVDLSPAGYSSSDYQETGHKETWLPIWRNPVSYFELKHLFGEGRSTVGRRMARNGIDFARAVGNLGVDRGIESLERYAFLPRRGKSLVAIPAGRFLVKYRSDIQILDELDPLTKQAEGFLRQFKTVPATLQNAHRQITEALFSCSRQPETLQFKNLIRALGRMVRFVALRDRSQRPALRKPIFGLSPRWIYKCDDGTIEVRVAAALASIKASGKVGPMASNMVDVAPSAPWKWTDKSSQKAWHGNSFPERLGVVLRRRLMDAERYRNPDVPLDSWLPLSPQDIMSFLWGWCDDELVEDLLWGFLLIDCRKEGLDKISRRWRTPLTRLPLSRTWCLLKTLHAPGQIHGIKITRDLRIAGLLLAGRVAEACDATIHRLRASRLGPFEVAYEDRHEANRLTASLLIPARNHKEFQSLVLESRPTNP